MCPFTAWQLCFHATGFGGEAAQRAAAFPAQETQKGRGEEAPGKARAHRQVPPVQAAAHPVRGLHGCLGCQEYPRLWQFLGHHQRTYAAAEGKQPFPELRCARGLVSRPAMGLITYSHGCLRHLDHVRLLHVLGTMLLQLWKVSIFRIVAVLARLYTLAKQCMH